MTPVQHPVLAEQEDRLETTWRKSQLHSSFSWFSTVTIHGSFTSTAPVHPPGDSFLVLWSVSFSSHSLHLEVLTTVSAAYSWVPSTHLHLLPWVGGSGHSGKPQYFVLSSFPSQRNFPNQPSFPRWKEWSLHFSRISQRKRSLQVIC